MSVRCKKRPERVEGEGRRRALRAWYTYTTFGVPGHWTSDVESLCGDAAGGGGAALEAVVLDGVDVLLNVGPKVLYRCKNARW